MRFGQWRGVTLAIALVGAAAASARADWFHTIPRETLAKDYRTGGVMYAPPIPYGCYAKDCVGTIVGLPGSCLGKLCCLCGGRGLGCGHCGGKGRCQHGDPCGNCGGAGCGLCQKGGHGLFHRRCSYDPCGGKGLFHHGGAGCGATPSLQQPAVACPQDLGGLCGKGKGLCGGKGHGGLFHHGGKGCGTVACDDPCGGAGKCGHCGGRGCGLCGGKGLCGHCGGLGCGLCGKVHAAVGTLLHHGDVKYFVGPGGPVPLTPGYVNYVVPVRSPRDYFAFPPFVDIDP
jgi:hypothetical protein